MEVGFGKLGLTPDQFWRLAPVELRTMAHGKFGKPQKPLSQAWLNSLIEKDRKRNGY